MKYLSLFAKNATLENISIETLLNCIKDYESESFKYDVEKSRMLTNEMRKDPVCCKWSEYLIFNSNLDSLYNAIVFLRLNGDGLELFNINSSNNKYAVLGKSQYNTIVLEFRKFMGESLSELFELNEIK